MSKLEELVAGVARNVAEAVDGKVEGWADRLFREAEDAAKRRLDDEERAVVVGAVRELGKAGPAVGRLGADRLRDVLGLLYDDQGDEARALWLAREATFEERRSAMREDTTASVAERDQREADWEAFWAAAKAAGSAAFKAAVPFLLAALA